MSTEKKNDCVPTMCGKTASEIMDLIEMEREYAPIRHKPEIVKLRWEAELEKWEAVKGNVDRMLEAVKKNLIVIQQRGRLDYDHTLEVKKNDSL